MGFLVMSSGCAPHYRTNLCPPLRELKSNGEEVDTYANMWQYHCERRGEIQVGETIGYGGDRGSMVYSVVRCCSPGLSSVNCQLVLKVYSTEINENEFEFIKILLGLDDHQSEDAVMRKSICRTLPYLVLPMATVRVDGVDRGILMAKRERNLKELLIYASKRHGSRGNAIINRCDDTMGNQESREGVNYQRTAFRWKKDFLPILQMEVIIAISFQLVLATACLNEELPHTVSGISYSGFAHNDIHLENILVEEKEGRVALCDFELVSSSPGSSSDKGPRLQPPQRRLPPPCRRSPRDFFCRKADSWGIGLVIISLLTGIDPLFDSTVVLDDFGEGPILRSHEFYKGNLQVLDWEQNIKPHVEKLLIHDDPTGRRLKEAQPLLHLCSKCLVNNPRADPCIPIELLSDPVFSCFVSKEKVSENILISWIKQIG